MIITGSRGPWAPAASLSILISITSLALFFAANNFALAHSIGQSMNQKVGNYLIDVGYDSLTPNPVAGEPTTFDVRLFDQNNNQTEFSDVQIDIHQADDSLVFHGDLKKSALGLPLVYVFPTGGDYKFFVRFYNGGQSLAENTFNLNVLEADYEQPPESPQKYWRNFTSGAIVGMVILGLIISLRDVWKRKKKY